MRLIESSQSIRLMKKSFKFMSHNSIMSNNLTGIYKRAPAFLPTPLFFSHSLFPCNGFIGDLCLLSSI
jgi:hypothetical protein